MAARYGDALAALQGSEDWPAPEGEDGTLLQAQILSRRSPIEALALLARTQDIFESAEGRFGYYVASMRAYSGTRNFDSAAEMGVLAERLIDQVSVSSKCLLWHQYAVLNACTERYNPHDPSIGALLVSNDPNGLFLGYLSRAYMYAGVGNYAEQKSDLTIALSIAVANPGACDLGLLALQVFGLLRLGLETGDEAAFSAAHDTYEWMTWSEDLSDERFGCLRAMAWEAFLRGETARAQWLLKDSKACAHDPAWKVMTHLDRSYIARTSGNEAWATEELLAAHTIARTVEWSATQGEERQALVMLAVLFAPTDMAQAQWYVSMYTQLGRDSVNPVLSLAQDRRVIAFEKYALGRVQQVLGNEAMAIKALESAYEIFENAQYHFRAAVAATAIFESTGDAHWKEKARRHADVFPHSQINATLQAHGEPTIAPLLRSLTPMQRQLAFALSEGLELAELSRRFSRSAYTLGKQVDIVFSHLGVTNRRALRGALQGWSFV
jgi:hypothetical protein